MFHYSIASFPSALRLLLLSALVGVQTGDYQLAYNSSRPLIYHKPHHYANAVLLNRIMLHMDYHKKSCRFVFRVLGVYPSSLYMRVIAGHCFLITRRFISVLNVF